MANRVTFVDARNAATVFLANREQLAHGQSVEDGEASRGALSGHLLLLQLYGVRVALREATDVVPLLLGIDLPLQLLFLG